MWANIMSTADFAKAALGLPPGPHEELLTRLLNEILRSPAAGMGPQMNFGGPSMGGAGVSPGAATTAPPKPLFEPQATHAALPELTTPSVAGLQPPLPAPSYGGPSVGGAGVGPGAVTTIEPKSEPTAASSAVPNGTSVDPLDALVASAISGSAYLGPSLSGFGTGPGIGTGPSRSALSPQNEGEVQPVAAPFASPNIVNVEPLGIGIPGEAGLAALFAQPIATPSAAARPSTYDSSASPFYFLNEPRLPANTGASSGAQQPPFQSAHPAFDVNSVRRDFPILNERVNGRQLIWLDNAATTQKPQSVIDRLTHFYEHENSNIHRAAHELAARATDAYEGARERVARFLGASSTDEIVFVRGATEAINLVAQSWGGKNIGEGDEIVITHLEHHANIVPWQQLALAKGAKLRIAPVDDSGQIILQQYGDLLGPKTRIVALPQVSNALGTITPAKQMIDMAHSAGALVLVDGAQAVSHMAVNVQELGADFYVFSGHKLFAPTGIGVVYGRKDLLDDMPPYQTGGNMISDVTFERTIFHGAPQRFEAGTGNIADAVGLGAAIDYIGRIGIENIGRYEHELLTYATKLLREIPGLTIIGTAPEKAGVISLVLKGIPNEEVGARLNDCGIAVRSGHHCAQPILRRFGLESTVRPSFAFYNTFGEIDTLAAALLRIRSESGASGL
jgi:cysteine desulfurase/selenocysteine lyase